MAKRTLRAEPAEGDLPALLDTLTIAVTTLDAVGVESYRQLYLYVMGETADKVVRDLRVENGQLIVGSPSGCAVEDWTRSHSPNKDDRPQLITLLNDIMDVWGWSTLTMATYLGCSTAMLMSWTNELGNGKSPILPRQVVERIRRLMVIDLIRCLSEVSDQGMPRWLAVEREGFGRRSIQQLLESNDRADFCQLVMWSLNGREHIPTVH